MVYFLPNAEAMKLQTLLVLQGIASRIRTGTSLGIIRLLWRNSQSISQSASQLLC